MHESEKWNNLRWKRSKDYEMAPHTKWMTQFNPMYQNFHNHIIKSINAFNLIKLFHSHTVAPHANSDTSSTPLIIYLRCASHPKHHHRRRHHHHHHHGHQFPTLRCFSLSSNFTAPPLDRRSRHSWSFGRPNLAPG